MTITLIPNVVRLRSVDLRKLGWLDEKRARTRSNFPANFQYVDLRGFTPEAVDKLLSDERAAYAFLEEADYSQAAIDEIDRKQRDSGPAGMLDFGVAAAVAALSALGCIPVTSCRGPTLGRHGHSQPAPMIVFYARRSHVPVLLEAVNAADCQIVNNGAKIEVYAEDVRKMHAFAGALRRRLPAAAFAATP